MEDGATNYFIFPVQAGEDATWLEGKEFSSNVIVRFSVDGESVQSEKFVLKPHTR